MTQLDDLLALRKLYWANGYRPVPISTKDKRPAGLEAMAWTDKARMNPPLASTRYPTADMLSTGILCDNLAAMDIDIDDPDRVAIVRDWLITNFGNTMTRYRDDSPRLLMLYASLSDRSKVTHLHTPTLKGTKPKESVEILGHGNQFVADGWHPNGALYRWRNGSPSVRERADLICLTDEQVAAFVAFCEPLMGVAPKPPRVPRTEIGSSDGDEYIGDIVAALDEISHMANESYDEWFRIACAIYDGTFGSLGGYDAFCNWSMSSSKYSDRACQRLWNSLDARGNGITVATLYGHVIEANPDWVKPSRTFTEMRIFNTKSIGI